MRFVLNILRCNSENIENTSLRMKCTEQIFDKSFIRNKIYKINNTENSSFEESITEFLQFTNPKIVIQYTYKFMIKLKPLITFLQF